jgi:putative ABC transport system permease protein
MFVLLPLGAAVALLAGAIVAASLMLLSVGARVSEIGLRRALGARPRDIALQFLCESTVTTFAGGVAGMLLGGAASLLLARRLQLDAALSWGAALLGLALSLLVGLLAGVAPARRAALMRPADALR